MKSKIILRGLKDTEALARSLAKWAGPGKCLLLSGDLGAGKTTLTRYLCSFLGVDQRHVTSPTFSLIHEYRGEGIDIAHVDLYRLGQGADVFELGLDEYMERGFFVVIEWADFLEDILDCVSLRLNITLLSDGTRQVEMESTDGNLAETISAGGD